MHLHARTALAMAFAAGCAHHELSQGPTGGRPPGSPPPAVAPLPALPPQESRAPATAAPNACSGAADCNACTSIAGCRFCTGPRKCVPASDATSCRALSLGHPSTCNNDPVTAERIEREREAERVASLTRGLTPVGPPVLGRLESFPGVTFPITRGQCFSVVYTISDDAKPEMVAMAFVMKTPRLTSGGRNMLTAKYRAVSTGKYCPAAPGTLSLRIEDWYRMSPVTRGGTGAIALQLYTEPVDPKKVDAELDAMDAAIRHAQSLPADCEGCAFRCESDRRACERRCFVDHSYPATGRASCEEGCRQIEASCESGCEARCR